MANEGLILDGKPYFRSSIILARRKHKLNGCWDRPTICPPEINGVVENCAPLAKRGGKICTLASHKDLFCAVISYFGL